MATSRTKALATAHGNGKTSNGNGNGGANGGNGSHRWAIGVMGMGHVGLPTALGLAELGWKVYGADGATDAHLGAALVGLRDQPPEHRDERNRQRGPGHGNENRKKIAEGRETRTGWTGGFSGPRDDGAHIRHRLERERGSSRCVGATKRQDRDRGGEPDDREREHEQQCAPGDRQLVAERVAGAAKEAGDRAVSHARRLRRSRPSGKPERRDATHGRRDRPEPRLGVRLHRFPNLG